MTLVLTHAKYQLLETARVPIAVIGMTFFPVAAMLFFVVPNIGDDPVAATLATASMVTFAMSTTCLFTYGIGVAEDRARPWEPFTRTLPAGAGPRFAGRIISGITFMFLSIVPVVIVAAVATEATATVRQLALAAGALLAGTIPFTLLGLAIGYALPSKAALAVAQVLFLPLAVGGGLMSDPNDMPGWMSAISPYLPTRGAGELMWAALTDFTVDPKAIAMLGAWTVVLAVVAGWAYRRDEGVRFS
ncbi:MAG: ABC transporter permease [Micromonosporaceae bacterium]